MDRSKRLGFLLAACVLTGGGLVRMGPTFAQQPKTSYIPTVEEPFDTVLKRMTADKPKIMKKHMDLLAERYDLSNRAATGAKMSKGKPVQEGVRAKLPSGVTWDGLAKMSPDEIKDKAAWPKAFLPLPHP